MFKECIFVSLSINLHASEFVDIERLSILSNSLLFKDGRTSVFKSDNKIAYDEERRKSD
jgi:hypothetical protein